MFRPTVPESRDRRAPNRRFEGTQNHEASRCAQAGQIGNRGEQSVLLGDTALLRAVGRGFLGGAAL